MSDRIDVRVTAFSVLAELRASEWMVAVHNDYHIVGEFRTFWLLTHPAGMFVKGEGKSDFEALMECERAAKQIFKP